MTLKLEGEPSTHQSLTRESRTLDRIVASVSPREKERRKPLEEMGKALTTIQPPNPYLEIEFSMEETQNCQ
jgi:hypothetical protein